MTQSADPPWIPHLFLPTAVDHSTLHFYNLKSSLSAPQMMVVTELEEPFLPLPDDLLVNLNESRCVWKFAAVSVGWRKSPKF